VIERETAALIAAHSPHIQRHRKRSAFVGIFARAGGVPALAYPEIEMP